MKLCYLHFLRSLYAYWNELFAYFIHLNPYSNNLFWLVNILSIWSIYLVTKVERSVYLQKDQNWFTASFPFTCQYQFFDGQELLKFCISKSLFFVKQRLLPGYIKGSEIITGSNFSIVVRSDCGIRAHGGFFIARLPDLEKKDIWSSIRRYIICVAYSIFKSTPSFLFFLSLWKDPHQHVDISLLINYLNENLIDFDWFGF